MTNTKVVPAASGLDADDVRAACQNAIEVFAEEENAEQCREVAEYMREVLLADLDRAAPQPSAVPDAWKLAVDNVAGYAHLYNSGSGIIHEIRAEHARLLAAAPSAPATVQGDGWIPVSERLPEVPDGCEQEVIVCVSRAHNGQSYVFSARYLNAFELRNDYDDEPMISTGWFDVKEHADYDGWYSPLIEAEGDAVTHWMPLPAAPESPAGGQ